MGKGQVLALAIVAAIAAGVVSAQEELYPSMFVLGDVTLLDGPFKHAMDLNVETLKKYTVDRLLFPYRKEAGLPTLGARNYVNWEGLDGHVGGHYLSALAIQYAATGDEECKTRMDYMVDALKECQDANGSDPDFVGYVGAVPNGKPTWRSIKGGNVGAVWDPWVPWYNIHKMYAGLRDAWVYGDNELAKSVFLKFCDWGIALCAGLNDNQMQQMMGNEFGGINEVYADAYYLTKEEKYLTFSKKFSHKDILDAMAQGRDNLDSKHANTQAAKVAGFERTAEVADDDYYHKATDYFWETVTKNRCTVIGGNSEDERFIAANDWMRYINERNGVETCNTYNMLKISDGLFRMNPDAKYADFYERALFNHILSTQHPEHGGYVYFTPSHPRHYRVYSAPDVAMWCCVGSGMENHTKYGEFIYTHQSDSLFVNLFIASEVDWKEKGVIIRQETQFPDTGMAVFTISAAAPTQFKLLIRHPGWVHKRGMVAMVGPDVFGLDSDPSTYITIDRTWNGGEQVKVLMKMDFSIERLNNVDSWSSIKRGPIVMASITGTDNLPGLIANDSRFGHSPSGTLMDVNSAPKLNINLGTFRTQFTPVAGKTQTYKAPGIFQNSADGNLEFMPFYRLHDARYMMYWNATITGNYPPDQDIEFVVDSITTVIANLKNEAPPGIRQLCGKLQFTFTTDDPTRRVVLYSLTGKKVAEIATPGKTGELQYGKRGLSLNSGMYTVQVISDGERISEKVCITK
ncbi:MAG: glycoside hydrolase family 127 protein [Chitinispirillaceae bacterium]|nr:glycoside hydrolase family 127 protein [Chitinispirillaceae bacterium]